MRRSDLRDLLVAGVLSAVVSATAPASGDGPPTEISPASHPRLVVQLGHQGAVSSVAFSPDGKQVLTGSADGTGAALGRGHGQGNPQVPRRRIRGYVRGVLPGGKQVLTGSDDATARLWDVATGKEIRKFKGHRYAVNFVAFSPDGKQVLTGSEDKTARLWDAASGKEIRRLKGTRARPHPSRFLRMASRC